MCPSLPCLPLSLHCPALPHYHSNTPKPWPPVAPLFSEFVKAWELKLSIRWGSLATVCNSGNGSPRAASGREALAGRLAPYWGHTPQLQVLSLQVTNVPQTSLSFGSGKKAERTALPSVAARTGVGTGSHPWGFRSQGQSTLRLICWCVSGRCTCSHCLRTSRTL